MSRVRQCPGGCGRRIPHSRFACGRCMGLLPAGVRRKVVAAAGKPASQSKTQVWNDAAERFGRLVRG